MKLEQRLWYRVVAPLLLTQRWLILLVCSLAANEYGCTSQFTSACFAVMWDRVGLPGGVIDWHRVSWILRRTRGIVSNGSSYWRFA